MAGKAVSKGYLAGPAGVSDADIGLPSMDPKESIPDEIGAFPVRSSIAPVYVIDACIGVKWFLDEDGSELATRLLIEAHKGYRRLIAPSLFWYEVTNALRWSPEQDIDFLRDLEALDACPIQCIDLPPGSIPILGALSRKIGLTVYDAVYVMLSMKYGVPLITEDRQLAAACAGFTPVLTLKQLFGSVLMETAEAFGRSWGEHHPASQRKQRQVDNEGEIDCRGSQEQPARD